MTVPKDMTARQGESNLWGAKQVKDTSSHFSWCLLAVIFVSLCIRAALSLHPYSGENMPPLYGDYEAQRHWMEVALHLPPSSWYQNSSDNDLSYWGLDYPPLSGYASWALGKLIELIEPSAVRLHSSRGLETPLSRAAMRFTVLLSDLLVFFPGLVIACCSVYRHSIPSSPSRIINTNTVVPVVAFCSTLPALILTDHGHFQYNGVSLGLFLFSIAFFNIQKDALGATFLCLSIYFKQMGLYYGLAIFAFLTGKLWKTLRRQGPIQAVMFLSRVVLSVVFISVVSFWPWLHDKDLLIGVMNRLFPLSRGLFEDKVANFWCSISVFIKMKRILPQDTLIRTCAFITALASLPFCAAVAAKPSPYRLLLSTSGCALSAYLFSYQVHEKQILLPLMPLCVLYGKHPHLAYWMSVVASASMFPLLQREGLLSAYCAVLMIHSALVSSTCKFRVSSTRKCALVLITLAASTGLALHLGLLLGKPPEKAPDIYVLLNTGYACAHFCAIYTALVYLIWTDTSV